MPRQRRPYVANGEGAVRRCGPMSSLVLAERLRQAAPRPRAGTASHFSYSVTMTSESPSDRKATPEWLSAAERLVASQRDVVQQRRRDLVDALLLLERYERHLAQLRAAVAALKD